MPTLVDCPSCQRKLRVPEELFGHNVKCPSCATTFVAAGPPAKPPEQVVPENASGQATEQASEPPAGAPTEGFPSLSLEPRAKLLLDEQVPPSSQSPSSPARAGKEEDDGFEPCPYCGERVRRDAARCRHCGEELDDEPDDERKPSPRELALRRDWEPHRGTLILVLGILSLVFMALCQPIGLVLGIIAWVMGQRDLRKIAAHTLDPEGQGLTQAGWICGIIGTILNGLMSLLMVAYIVVAVAFISNSATRTAPRPTPVPRRPGQFQVGRVPLRIQEFGHSGYSAVLR